MRGEIDWFTESMEIFKNPIEAVVRESELDCMKICTDITIGDLGQASRWTITMTIDVDGYPNIWNAQVAARYYAGTRSSGIIMTCCCNDPSCSVKDAITGTFSYRMLIDDSEDDLVRTANSISNVIRDILKDVKAWAFCRLMISAVHDQHVNA